MEKTHKESSAIMSFFKCKCPRCRQGHMFEEPNPWKLKKTMKMHEVCPVCGQPFNLEVGFYYGSSYVSYALTVALSAFTFVAWWFLIGFSFSDNRLFYWIAVNAFLLIALQPYFMRVGRAGWLAFFVRYDKDWVIHPVALPERVNKTHEANW